MKKSKKYIIGVVIALLVLYFSFDIENLEEHRAKSGKTKFNAEVFANKIWDENLMKIEAPDASVLIKQLNENKQKAFDKYGRKLGIAQTHYFLLQGTGIVQSVEKEYISVLLNNNNDSIKIISDFIFGNAVRDGSGLVDINNFTNMTDFNNVSIELNKKVRKEVVLQLKKSASAGMKIDFAGVAELRKDKDIPISLSIIPIKANLSNDNKQ